MDAQNERMRARAVERQSGVAGTPQRLGTSRKQGDAKRSVPRFVMPIGGVSTEVPYWPEPMDDALVRTYEGMRAATLERLSGAAALSSDELARLEAIVSTMNADMAQLFSDFIEPAVRSGAPLADDDRLAYLERWSAAGQKAEAEITTINARMPEAIDSAAFVAQSLMDLGNVQRHRTF